MWANNFEKCICCGTTEILHASQGLCRRCYGKYHYRKSNPPKCLSPQEKTLVLSNEYLLQEYVENRKSLSDIAKEYGCTRQYIFKLLKKYGIPVRKKRDARLLALEKGKVICSRIDKDGNSRNVTHIKAEVDEYFFSYWTAPMAWVLGFIYADGNLDSGSEIGNKAKLLKYREPRVNLSQKDPEILEKIKALMKSNQRLIYSKERKFKNTTAGELYHLVYRSRQIFCDLTKLGLTPNKSLTINFPDIPNEYIWHFIRGLWDGDGCIYIEKRTGNIFASYVSGSLAFIEKFIEILKKELKIENISIDKTKGTAYQFRLSTKSTLKLCHHFYDGVSADMFLSRKYKVYMKYLECLMSKQDFRVKNKTGL